VPRRAPFPKKDQICAERVAQRGLSKIHPAFQVLELAQRSGDYILPPVLRPQLPICSKRYPEIGAVELLLDRHVLGKQSTCFAG
jgi:hypothetical protein